MEDGEDQQQPVDECFPGGTEDLAQPTAKVVQQVPSAFAQASAAQEMLTLSQNAPGVVAAVVSDRPEVDLSRVISAAVTGLDIQDPLLPHQGWTGPAKRVHRWSRRRRGAPQTVTCDSLDWW